METNMFVKVKKNKESYFVNERRNGGNIIVCISFVQCYTQIASSILFLKLKTKLTAISQ